MPPDEFYFVSFPSTGYPDNNFPAMRRAVDALRATGINAVSPYYDATAEDMPASNSIAGLDMLKRDLGMVCSDDCAGLVLLDGWEHSFGCRAEWEAAEQLGVPCLQYREHEGYAELEVMP